MKALQIIIDDCLQYHDIQTSNQNIKEIVEFLVRSTQMYSVLYVNEQSIYVSVKAIKDQNNCLVLENIRLSQYIESSNHEFPLIESLVDKLKDLTDPVQISYLSDIPYGRIVNEHVAIDNWSSGYKDTLRLVYKEIKPILEYVNDHGLLESIEHQDESYMKMIREFITNELQ